jgi:hypothetical protein
MESNIIPATPQNDVVVSAPTTTKPPTVEELIAKLKSIPKVEAYQKRSIMKVNELRVIATHFRIPAFVVKPILLNGIYNRLEKNETLDVLGQVNQRVFKRDKNTFPRIIHILLQYHDE